MPNHTIPPVETTSSSAVSQEMMDALKRLNRESMHQANLDLSFMSFLEMPLAWGKHTLHGRVQTEMLSDSDPVSQDKAKLEEAEKQQKKRNESAKSLPESVAPRVEPLDPVSNDLNDVMDMWVMDAQQMNPADMKVLLNLPQTPPLYMLQNFSSSLLEQLPHSYYKSLQVSKELQEMLEKAYKTQRPLRIDLSDSASVILRLGRDGRVSAEFLPTDQAADLFFRQNLLELKNRLEAKQLPFGELQVRDWKQQKEKEKRQQ